MTRQPLLIVAALALAVPAPAAVRTETVEYRHGAVVLKGYLAYDDALSGQRPGVLVVHEWWGLNDYAKRRAEALAQLGYVALAADMYGDGFVTTAADEAGKRAAVFKNDRPLARLGRFGQWAGEFPKVSGHLPPKVCTTAAVAG